MAREHHDRDKTLAQKLSLLFGVTFLLVGILGFIPGITTNFDDIKFAGENSDAELLGLFQVSILHNIAHALFGIGILAARKHRTALQYLLYSGIAYLALTVYGLVVGQESNANFLPFNSGDDVLHAALTLALLGSWAASRGAHDPDHAGHVAGDDRSRDRVGTGTV